MDAHKDGSLESVGKIYPLFEGNTNVVDPGHFHLVAGADQFPPGGKRNVQREAFLRPPATRRALIGASVTWIEHYRLDPFRFMNSARPQNWLDDFAHVHDR